uniref:Leucine rich repeat containing 23 n=1 Tax=Varanus komodoensis TaxID=61221 RepID=A0A8D2KSY2_VARKO
MSDEEPEDENDAEEQKEDVEEKEGDEGGEGEEEKEAEEEETQVSNPLTEDILKESLSLLCKTGNGLAHAFVKLELTDIAIIQSFIHLRYVDLSDNLLRDLSPLACLTHLLWLKVDGNRLTSASMDEMPYLQIASFANNHIKDTNGISHPRLTSLNLKGGSFFSSYIPDKNLFSAATCLTKVAPIYLSKVASYYRIYLHLKCK